MNTESKTIFAQTIDGTIADLDSVVSISEIESAAETAGFYANEANCLLHLALEGIPFADERISRLICAAMNSLDRAEQEADRAAALLLACPVPACWKAGCE